MLISYRTSLLAKFSNKSTFSSSSIRPSAQIIDGRKLAQTIKDEVNKEIETRVELGYRRPQLTTILVGNNPSSISYVKNKIAATKYVGIKGNLVTLESSVSEKDILTEIEKYNLDGNVDGVLVQLPLPDHLNEYKICNAVNPKKDVDGFHFLNAGQMYYDVDNGLLPCTAIGVIEMLKRLQIETFGKTAVICGRSKNVGLAISLLLQADGNRTNWGMDATVTICNRNTPREELVRLAKNADILVSAVGVPNLITKDLVKPGACVIDVGINRTQLQNGEFKTVGDVDFKEVSKVARYITPVPGGVGPMTIAILMRNTLIAHKLNYV